MKNKLTCIFLWILLASILVVYAIVIDFLAVSDIDINIGHVSALTVAAGAMVGVALLTICSKD